MIVGRKTLLHESHIRLARYANKEDPDCYWQQFLVSFINRNW